MKKVLFGLVLLLGVASATPSFAIFAQPILAGAQGCPPGMTFVSQPQLVTYNVPTGRIITVPVYGPLGLRIIRYDQVAETTPVTTFVQAGYCVPGIVVLPYPH